MARIAVEPQALREMARQVRLSVQRMEDLSQRSSRAYQSLDWEAHRRADLEERVLAAESDAGTLSAEAAALSQYLELKAAAFEEADNRSSTDLNQLGARFPDLTVRVAGSAPPLYDGLSPAAGTTSEAAWAPVTPPVTNVPGARSAAAYNQVLNQFAVAHNPRYTPRDTTGDGATDTFCNIFVWDATRAMGAEIPHWVGWESGSPVEMGKGQELNANGVAGWLVTHGPAYGWREVPAADAQAAANQGMPAVAAWNSQSGAAGHVAMVRPGTYSEESGPTIAQAGSLRSNETTTAQGFGRARPRFYIHD